MTPLQRSRRLQAGVAGLGIVGALGASFGIGAATHTGSGQPAGSGRSGASSSGTPHQAPQTTTHDRSRQTGSQTPSSGVTAPQPSAPQATTSGS